ncbi:hypothetical protein J2X72_001512 [Phyllobacterium sp. 1468]|nr:hypothetical protein [Phyllobacterium sp. 1468]
MVQGRGFGKADAYPSDEAEAGPIHPDPSGFRLADTHFVWRTPTLSGGHPLVRRLRTMVNVGLATFRVNCRAIRETQLASNKQNLL